MQRGVVRFDEFHERIAYCNFIGKKLLEIILHRSKKGALTNKFWIIHKYILINISF